MSDSCRRPPRAGTTGGSNRTHVRLLPATPASRRYRAGTKPGWEMLHKVVRAVAIYGSRQPPRGDGGLTLPGSVTSRLHPRRQVGKACPPAGGVGPAGGVLSDPGPSPPSLWARKRLSGACACERMDDHEKSRSAIRQSQPVSPAAGFPAASTRGGAARSSLLSPAAGFPAAPTRGGAARSSLLSPAAGFPAAPTWRP
jgi:hypothetical protein